MDGPSDEQLIARVLAEDDRHAFATLVRRHQSTVRSLLRRLTSGDAGTADDLAQQTFVQAWTHLDQFRGGASFSSWLYRIAYHGYLSHARRPVARSEEEAVDAREAPSLESAAHTRVDLDRAMSCLRPEERAALALTYARDVSHEQAAEILEIPLGTLKAWVLRGKARLREQMVAYREGT
jgi:RNA polymerase sigma-70 factor (ECF subfamily)